MNEKITTNSDKIRLSKLDRQVLAAVNLNAEMELKAVAKIVGCQIHSARYSLNKLITEGVIRKRWMINSYKLGWARCGLYLTTTLAAKSAKTQFSEFLIKSPAAGFVLELAGGYDYLVSLFVRNTGDVLKFQDQLAMKCGNIVLSKSVCARSSLTFFSRKYLASHIARSSVTFQEVQTIENIDQTDLAIVKTLASACAETHREIAESLNMPPTTFDYRLQRLRAQGIVMGTMYSVNSKRYGATGFTLLFYASNCHSQLRKQLFNYAHTSPYTVCYLEGTGEWDVDIDIEVESYEQLQFLREDLSQKFKNDVREIKVIPNYRLLKDRFFPLQG